MSLLLLPVQRTPKSARRRASLANFRPRFEGLEDRTVMSASVAASAAFFPAPSILPQFQFGVVTTAAPPVATAAVGHSVAVHHHKAATHHPSTTATATAQAAAATATTTTATTATPAATAATTTTATTTTTTPAPLVTLQVNPIDVNLLGLEVKLDDGSGGPVTVNVSAETGAGDLLGNLLGDVSNLLNTQSVSTALNNVLGSAVDLLNQTKLNVTGVNTGGPLGSTTAVTTTPVLDVFLAPIHLNLLGAVVTTSPIHLTITAHSGPGQVLGDIVTDLANLLNKPPHNGQLTLSYLIGRLGHLLNQVGAQLPGFVPPLAAPAAGATTTTGTERVLGLSLPPIDLNLLGLVLKTSSIQVNADIVKGNGDLVGNLLGDLLTTLKATPTQLTKLSAELNQLLGTAVNVLNASSLLPLASLSSLTPLLQQLATTNVTGGTTFPTTPTPVLDLNIASNNGMPPVNVNLLGLKITTSNVQVQLLAQPGQGQTLGNLVYNVANLLNPDGSANVLGILGALGV